MNCPSPALSGTIFGDEQRCFGCGPAHPFGFRLHFRVEQDEVVTEFVPGADHQGAPNVMHGGLVTTLADEIGGWTLIALRERFGFTGSMNSRFLRPVRIGRVIEGRGRIVRESGRTAHVEVRLLQDGETCFRSAMTFAILDQRGAEKMLDRELPTAWKRYIRA